MNDSSGYYTPQSNSLDFVTPTDGPKNANMLEQQEPLPQEPLPQVKCKMTNLGTISGQKYDVNYKPDICVKTHAPTIDSPSGDIILSRYKYKYKECVTHYGFNNASRTLKHPSIVRLGHFIRIYTDNVTNEIKVQCIPSSTKEENYPIPTYNKKEFELLYTSDDFIKRLIDRQVEVALYEQYLIKMSKGENAESFDFFINVDLYFDRMGSHVGYSLWHVDTFDTSIYDVIQVPENEKTLTHYVSLTYITNSNKNLVGTYLADRNPTEMDNLTETSKHIVPCMYPMTLAVSHGITLFFSNLKLSHATPPNQLPPSLIPEDEFHRGYKTDIKDDTREFIKSSLILEKITPHTSRHTREELLEMQENTSSTTEKRSFIRMWHISSPNIPVDDYDPFYVIPSSAVSELLNHFREITGQTQLLDFDSNKSITIMTKECVVQSPEFLGGFKSNGGNDECLHCSTVTEIANDPNENIILFSSASQKKPRTLAKGMRMRFKTRKYRRLTRKKNRKKNGRRTIRITTKNGRKNGLRTKKQIHAPGNPSSIFFLHKK